MKLANFRLNSLKTKVVLMTLVTLVISIWLLASYISMKMREDIQGILGDQQVATVSLAAAEINSGFQERMEALQLAAKSLDASLFDRPASMQQLIERNPIFQVLFNAGIFVTRSDGTAIAEVPKIGRVGLNYMDRDHVAAALTQGQATVGKPIVGKTVRAPSFAITLPMRDAQGKVIGALVGATDLSQPNFLDNVNESHYGRSGGYLVVDPRNRLFVTATNKALVMAPLPAEGVNPVLDRRLQGFDGAAVNVNSLGIEVLTSSGRIPAAGWFLISTLPTQEVFAPIHAMQQHVLEVTALITVLTCGLVWLLMSGVLKRQFAPMISATQELDDLSRKQASLQPLPVTSHDEVGALIGAFNRLLINLGQREDSLLESEKRSTLAQEGAHVGVWEWNIATGKTYWSGECERLYGFEPGTLKGRDQWRRLVHPEDLVLIDSQWETMIARGESFEVEFRYQRTAGETRWMVTKGRAQYDAEGKPIGLFGINVDITERKLAEMELKKSEHLLRDAQQAANIGCYTTSLETGVWECTPVMNRLFGITEDYPHTIEGWVDFMHPDFSQPMNDYLRMVIKDKKPFDTEYKMRRPSDGAERWMHGLGQIAYDDKGKAISLIGTVQDITERKQTEVEMRLHSNILNNLSEGVYLIRCGDGAIVFTNPRFDQMFGYQSGELLGKHVSTVNAPTEESPEAVANAIVAALGATGMWNGEVKNIRKDGTTFWCHARVSTFVHHQYGEVWVAVHEDITEHKRLEQETLEQRRFLDAVIENVEAHIYVKDGDGRYLYINQAVATQFGRPVADILGKSDLDILPPETARKLMETDSGLQLSGARYAAEEMVPDSNGTPRYFWSVKMPIAMRGHPHALIGFSTDITERKRIELALADSQTELKAAQRLSHLGNWHWDIRTDLHTWSEEVFAIYGLQQQGGPVPYPEVQKYFTAQSWAELVAVLQRCRADGGSYHIDAELVRSDGSRRWVALFGNAVRDQNGDITALHGTMQDITERKLAEEAQRIAATAFESQQGMIITDARKVILRVNKAFTEVTGYTAEEAVGQTPGLLKSGRQDAAFYAAMWDSISRSGTWQGEIWNRRKNGTVYPEHLSISTVKNDVGVLTHYVGAFSDITFYKAAEEQIHDLAYTDLLTGLPNRRMLIVRLQQAINAAQDHRHQCALLLVDLDHFKNLNDSLGHEQGDEVLKGIAKRLSASVRGGDTVARLGGDEFAVLLDPLSQDPQIALRQVESVKMLAALGQPYKLGNRLRQ